MCLDWLVSFYDLIYRVRADLANQAVIFGTGGSDATQYRIYK